MKEEYVTALCDLEFWLTDQKTKMMQALESPPLEPGYEVMERYATKIQIATVSMVLQYVQNTKAGMYVHKN
jgi:hypothetical protein